jgi:hypothetical protein
LGTLPLGTPSPHPREAIAKQTVAAVPLDSSAGRQNSTAELFSRLIVRHLWQETHLDRLSVTRIYNVLNEKDEIVAEQIVVMEYTAPDTETFTSSSEKGSGFVLHHVFQRLMEDEKKRLRANKDPDRLITSENYTFEIVGTERIGSSNYSIVHAIPKRNETDLFEGRIWIDNQDFAIVKITGHLAKNPSFWIRRVDFERDYQKISGFWLLSREEAISAVRIFGKEIYLIEEQPGEEPPYERLLSDAMVGDGALFTCEDAVEAAWAVVEPVLKNHHRVRPYKRKGWGPKQDGALIASGGGWHNPES